MKTIIPNWYHKKGRHCASTALRDAMRFWGVPFSEAFCFGLGRGLGAFYLKNPSFSPSRWLMTRSADLEKKFFTSLGIPFKWKQAENESDAWERTKEDIDNGIPVLLQTDLFYLDYYNTKTHFNRHAVLLWGYDEESGLAYLSDTDWEGLVTVPLVSLSKARCSDFPPGPVKFDWFPIRKPEKLPDLNKVALQAIKLNAFELFKTDEKFPLKLGTRALKELASDLPSWGEAHDWKWSARFAYQAIERRGTGGGAFRKMYANFLEEVEKNDGAVKKAGLAILMRSIGEKWTEFALCLKEISEKETPIGFDKASELASELFEMESNYCNKALGLEE